MRARRHVHKYHFNLGNQLFSKLITNHHEHREQEHQRELNLRAISTRLEVEPSVTPPRLRWMSNETRPSRLAPEPPRSLPLLEWPAPTPIPSSRPRVLDPFPFSPDSLGHPRQRRRAPRSTSSATTRTGGACHFLPIRPALPPTSSFTVSEAPDPYREFYSATVIPHFAPLPAVPPKPPRPSAIPPTSPTSYWSTLSLP